MPAPDYDAFFATATGGQTPYAYQRRLAGDTTATPCASRLTATATGQGKTATQAVMSYLRPHPSQIRIQLLTAERTINPLICANSFKLSPLQAQQTGRLSGGNPPVFVVIKNYRRSHGAVQVPALALGEDGHLFRQGNGDSHNNGQSAKRKTFRNTGLQRGRAPKSADISGNSGDLSSYKHTSTGQHKHAEDFFILC